MATTYTSGHTGEILSGSGDNSATVQTAVETNETSVVTTPVGVLNATAVVVAKANKTTCGPRHGVTTTGNKSKVKV